MTGQTVEVANTKDKPVSVTFIGDGSVYRPSVIPFSINDNFTREGFFDYSKPGFMWTIEYIAFSDPQISSVHVEIVTANNDNPASILSQFTIPFAPNGKGFFTAFFTKIRLKEGEYLRLHPYPYGYTQIHMSGYYDRIPNSRMNDY
jgi:hypothetical protein